ncbi:M90 family metallopeptidase [Bizionia myxarmorum]|uniref:Zinc-dependent peptidase n=1 Tax=Bizionia myxarmorum TaxID=291186 RepID=A0A5D0QYK3_9FLAO|nr:M90 family metallopeptidase [Bizionia myxarmorum]TYB74287.1 zinc-dependent peptidase [Bizionia myxarmorum]
MTFTIVALIAFAGFGIFALIATRKKSVKPFPEAWKALLLEHVNFYSELSKVDQKRFQKRMMVFLSEVYLDSVGFELEDLDKILIASSAVIPVFSFSEWHYHNLSTVLVYPENFNEDLGFKDTDEKRHIAGVVGNGRFEKQMILSRKALHFGFQSSSHKTNTAVHEFVHLIDKMDGITDGVPERLISQPYVIPWLKLIHREMEAINDNKSDIRHYGGTNEAEFLAVASEYFFEQPKLMKKKHPELYKMLTACFRTN